MTRAQIYEKYRTWSVYPLFLAGLLFILGLLMMLQPETFDDHRIHGRALRTGSWLVFLADYIISIILTDHRLQYVRTHILQAIGVLFPPLRIVLIFHLTWQVVQHSRARFGTRIRLFLVYVTTLVVLTASVTVTLAERHAPGANILNLGDALWWSAVTISTVGYGDFFPVTVWGRLIAVALMINGFAILSVLTATIAQQFMDNQRKYLNGLSSSNDAEPEEA